MIIEKIEIGKFGMLSDTAMEFSPTVNVIEGGNEAGKSTIAAFIKYMLYGFDTEDTPEAELERKKRVQWQTGAADGRMTVRVRGKRFLIARSTVVTVTGGRTAYKEDSSIIDLDTGTPAFGKQSAGEVFFGTNRVLFENTAFLGTMGDAGISSEAVSESIENILFSGSEKQNSKHAMEKLDDKMEALLHKNGMGGTITDLKRQGEELEHVLEISSEDNRRILEKEAELHEVRLAREAAEKKRDKLHELDEYYKKVMVIQTFDKLHELEKEAEAADESYRTYLENATYQGFLPDEAYLAEIRTARRMVGETFSAKEESAAVFAKLYAKPGTTKEIESAIEHADSLGGEASVRSKGAALRKSHRLRLAGSLVSFALALGAGMYALLSYRAAEQMPMLLGACAAGVLLILSVVLLCLALKSKKQLASVAADFGTRTYADLMGKLSVIADVRQKRDTMRLETERAKAAADAAALSYDNAKKTLTELILRWSDTVPSNDLYGFLDSLEERVETFLKEKNRRLEEKNLTEITVKEIRRTLSDKSEIDIRAGVSPLKRKALAEINHDEIINGLANCKNEMVEKEKEIVHIESELDLLKNRAVDPGEIYTKMRRLNEQVGELMTRHKAYYLAYHAIGQANDALREEVSPRIGKFASALLLDMSNKKYSDLNVDGDLTVTFTDEEGVSRRADLLSGGTQDMMYFSVRMALLDMLYTEKPPMVFDETFAHQDNMRAEAMMHAIAHMAEDGCQSFIFTCRSREAALAAKVAPKASVYRLSNTTVTD